MYTVRVKEDAQGSLIGISNNNPEYGYIRVESTVREIREGGWLKYTRRSALIKGLVEDLKQAGFKAGEEITGQIIVKESLEPFNPENPEKNLKRAGSDGVILTREGKPIYRETFFTVDPYKEDEFIAHDNIEEVKSQMEVKKLEGTSLTEMFKEGLRPKAIEA